MSRSVFAAVALTVMTLTPLQAATITIDFDTPATGSTLDSSPLVTGFGTITAVNLEIRDPDSDPEFSAAGASGNVGDHLGMPGPVPVLSFDFDVSSISLIYGGNGGDITIQVRDGSNNILDTFFQASTGGGFPAGPVTLNGPGIRSLEWFETSGSFAPIDNLSISTGGAAIPEPSTFFLLAAGLALAAVRRRAA